MTVEMNYGGRNALHMHPNFFKISKPFFAINGSEAIFVLLFTSLFLGWSEFDFKKRTMFVSFYFL